MNSSASYQQVLAPQSVTGDASPAVIDTQGAELLEVVVNIGTGPATKAMIALKLKESDGKNSPTALDGNAADVPGTIFGTSYTLAAASNTPCAAGGTASAQATVLYPLTQQYPVSALPASNNTLFVFFVALKGRRRYLLPIISTGDAQATLLGVIARLSRADVAPKLPSDIVPANGGVLQCPPYYPDPAGN